MNKYQVEAIIAKAIEYLNTSEENTGAVIDGILTFIILNVGSTQGLTDANAATVIPVALDTGVEIVDFKKMIPVVFEKALTEVTLRPFARYFPERISSMLEETRELLMNRFMITDLEAYYSGLFPSAYKDSKKFGKKRVQKALSELDVSEDVEHIA
jgi:hypothetical protein